MFVLLTKMIFALMPTCGVRTSRLRTYCRTSARREAVSVMMSVLVVLSAATSPRAMHIGLALLTTFTLLGICGQSFCRSDWIVGTSAIDPVDPAEGLPADTKQRER